MITQEAPVEGVHADRSLAGIENLLQLLQPFDPLVMDAVQLSIQLNGRRHFQCHPSLHHADRQVDELRRHRRPAFPDALHQLVIPRLLPDPGSDLGIELNLIKIIRHVHVHDRLLGIEKQFL
ncbi:MAG TPA: hypothetical protein PLN21_21295 [Gemmatales bacterium]|nr:hypothetical protein [Gemmatales bacterium]